MSPLPMGPATQSSLYKGVDVWATIGSRFKDLRKKAGLTQEAMAKKLQIARSTVGMYEIDTKKVSKEVAQHSKNMTRRNPSPIRPQRVIFDITHSP
jgi:DNA-binding XRE family transcriptional regulator